ADALAAKGHGLPVHVLPEKLDVPWIGAEEERPQIEVDDLFRDQGGEGGVADAHEAVVGEDLDDQPAVKRERAHGGLGPCEQVHGVRAEVRRERDRLASPLHDPGPDLLDLHGVLFYLTFHSWIPADHCGGSVTSSRSPLVVTGSNVTLL